MTSKFIMKWREKNSCTIFNAETIVATLETSEEINILPIIYFLTKRDDKISIWEYLKFKVIVKLDY